MHFLRHTLRIVPLVMVLLLTASAAYAFRFEGAGAKIGVLDPEGSDGAPLASAHLEFAQPGTSWHLMPSIMFWDSDVMTGMSGNFDMYYHFLPGSQATPYAGTGVGVNHFDPEGPDNGRTKLGLNLFGGLRVPTGGTRLFIEGRYTASEVSQIALLGGITFLGGR
jgi:hypothetical protein